MVSNTYFANIMNISKKLFNYTILCDSLRFFANAGCAYG